MELGPQHPVTNHTTQLKACRELFLFYNLGFRCKVKQATPGTLSWHMLMLQVIICSLFFQILQHVFFPSIKQFLLIFDYVQLFFPFKCIQKEINLG
jgi:hypothetical protein